jgi:hypothetical protein
VNRPGRRFLINLPPPPKDLDPLTLVVNWTAELKK